MQAREAATAAMSPFTVRRTRSCQYRTGPDEAGRNGPASRDGNARFQALRNAPDDAASKHFAKLPRTVANYLARTIRRSAHAELAGAVTAPGHA